MAKTCGSCVYLVRKQMAKTYLKCSLMLEKWTGGGGTDVRARDPACREWDSRDALRAATEKGEPT